MDIRLTSEQEALQRSVRSLAQKFGTASAGGGVVESDPGAVDAAFSQLGLNEILDTSSPNGWMGSVEAAIVTMELARHLVPLSFVGRTAMATPILQECGLSNDSATMLLGSSLDSWILRHDETVAVAWDSSRAGLGVGLRALPAGIEAVTVSLDGSTMCETADQTRTTLETELAGARVIGSVDQTFLTRWHANALTMMSADLVGLMEGSLGAAVQYAKSRVQFGRPIGAFQAVQHLLAQHHVALQGARIATLYAAWCVQSEPPDVALTSAHVAKAVTSEAAVALTEASIQVHGGMGFTWDHCAHHYLRRALFDRSILGTEKQHYRWYFEHLLEVQTQGGQ